MWVMVAIYLTVIGWAYAIGSLLALLQDRAFRQALALQRFGRRGARGCSEPFLLIAGLRARPVSCSRRSLDAPGPPVRRRRSSEDRIDALDARRLPASTCPAWSATPATRTISPSPG